MANANFQIRQLADELQPPESGKQSIVLLDDADTKVVLFAFAAEGGRRSHGTYCTVSGHHPDHQRRSSTDGR